MRFHFLFLILVGSLLLNGQARAADSFDYHCADVELLQVKVVQKELNVTDAQRKKMNEAANLHRSRLQTYDAQQQAAKTKDTPAQQRTKLKGFYDLLKQGVLTQLSAGQLKRLRELTLQRAGLTALLDKVVATKVGFTSAQTEQYRKAFVSGADKARALEQQVLKPILDKYRVMNPKTDAEKTKLQEQMKAEVQAMTKKYAPQMQKIQGDTEKTLRGIFTAANKTAWNALMGKQFAPK